MPDHDPMLGLFDPFADGGWGPEEWAAEAQIFLNGANSLIGEYPKVSDIPDTAVKSAARLFERGAWCMVRAARLAETPDEHRAAQEATAPYLKTAARWYQILQRRWPDAELPASVRMLVREWGKS